MRRQHYDTDVATYIASYEIGSIGDRNHHYEGLYVTRHDEYFLHGMGGPDSIYRGEKILPLSIELAKKWAANNAQDDYEDIFKEPLP